MFKELKSYSILSVAMFLPADLLADGNPASYFEAVSPVEMILGAGLLLFLSVLLYMIVSTYRNSKNRKRMLDKLGSEPSEEVDTKPVKTPEEEIEDVRETSVEEPEPVAETAVEEPRPTVVEEPEAPQTEEVAEEPVRKATRKQREPRQDRGKITKDDLVEFSGMRLLVAEDNMINQKVLDGIFAQSGVELTMAENGEIALDILSKDTDYDLILMDAHMPVVDGFEATRRIRSNPSYDHIAVIALSGDTATDDIRKMTEAGMEGHLEKPIQMDALYDVLYCYRHDESKDDVVSEEEESTHLTSTFELLSEDGLDVAGGDEELYREILEEFKTMYADSDQKLNDYLVHDDLDSAKSLLLDVKGVAANIGAGPLSEVAEALREAILENRESEYIRLGDNYKEHLQALLRDIEKI